MKKLIITVALFVFMSGMYLSAQAEHEFSVYAGGGLSSLSYKLSSGNASKGGGGDFGVGYTYFLDRERAVETGTVFHEFWGVYTGLGISVYNAKAKLNNVETVTANLRDSENDLFDLHTTLSGYKETQSAIFLTIPVMAHFQMAPFYVMGGIKAGIPLSGKYKSKNATLINEGWYPEKQNWAKTQTFAGYGSFRGKDFDGKLDLGLSMMLAFEAGMSWSINSAYLLYGGAYFDYGLNNIAKGDNKKFINYVATDAENFTTNSVLSSYVDDSNSTAFTSKVNTMAVGIKVRVAFKK